MSGDYTLEATVYFPFTTRAFATGIPTALVSGAVDWYEDVTATPIVTGETLSVSLNSVAGFNMITCLIAAAEGFEAGKSYTAILQAGTVASVSAVGEVVAHFTCAKSAAAEDLANATDGLTALAADIAALPVATDIVTAGAITTLAGAVVNVDLTDTVTTYTGNTLQTGDVITAINDLANGTDGLTALKTAVDAIPTTAMRGTDNAALATALTTAQNDLDIITDSDGVILGAAGVDLIWDEDIEAAHTTSDSAGLILANTTKLSTGAGGISATMDTFTPTTCDTEVLTEAATVQLDGSYHECSDTGAVLDFYYEFDVGVTGIATECIWDGYVTTNNDACEIYGWNWVSTAWTQIGVINGTTGNTVQEKVFIVTNVMTGTGANVGKVRIRFASDGGDKVTNVATDRILIEYTALPGAGTDLHDGLSLVGSTSTTLNLDAGASAVDDYYNSSRVVLTEGTGAGQERIITDYVGGTQIATVSPAWTTTPDATSAFIIEPARSLDFNSTAILADTAVIEPITTALTSAAAATLALSTAGVITGLAQTGTLSTTVMTTDLTGYVNDELIGREVIWTGGTADGQAATITDYASASGTVTYDTIITLPANNDPFVIV